jgi:nucleoside 2-deoxyribosyltransferase
MTDAIREADLIVADVSRKNPNVLYELGYAHALRKPTLLLLSTDETGEMPFDLAGYQMVIYDPQNLRSLQQQIMRFLDYQQSRWEAQS